LVSASPSVIHFDLIALAHSGGVFHDIHNARSLML
jgi:hypothetical protein